jgi:maltooligosyltrehalose trehalohydrolase
VEVVLEGSHPRSFSLTECAGGIFAGFVPGLEAGSLYRYRLDGRGPFPDPASRFQPQGVHGPSQVIDAAQFCWNDESWQGVARDQLVIYELHVGTFSKEGTFQGVIRRLPELASLGVTALELMPVADFPGNRNWGYDGVNLFAPARCYGRPDDLRNLVDAAHRLGLAVLLDVVYNHLGPDGNYLAEFSPHYFSRRNTTPWGPAINLDGHACGPVRSFLIENAIRWLSEYHLDGLRLDATHRLFDDSPRHFLAELSSRVRESITDRSVVLIAEDPRNLASMVKPEAEEGWGLDAVWSDDFHHELRRYLVGDADGAFRDFRGRLSDLARTINQGWLFCGSYSIHRGYIRGTDPTGLEPSRFVFCLQNHDRIGSRALGERLNHQVDLATYRAASALLLTAPATPLLFMGQEWGATAPFVFFTDHHDELGRLVKEGRRHEFRDYAAFADPAALERIPDCQAEQTFLSCKLDWAERERKPHAGLLRLYQALLALRKTEPALRSYRRGRFKAQALDEDTMLLCREADCGSSIWVVVRLRGAGSVDLADQLRVQDDGWELILTTEDSPFAALGSPPRVDLTGSVPQLDFPGPAAVLLRRTVVEERI